MCLPQDGALSTALFIVFTNDSYVHRAMHFLPQCSSSSRTSLMFTGRCTLYHIVHHRHDRALCSQGGVLSTTMFIVVTNEPYVRRAVYFLPHRSPSSQTSPMFTGRCTFYLIVHHRHKRALCSHTQGGVLSITSFIIVTNKPYVHIHRTVYFLPHRSSSSRTSPSYVHEQNSSYHQYMEVLQWPKLLAVLQDYCNQTSH